MIEHVWQADEYYCHSSAQRNAALELLGYLGLKGDEQIIDVGCGDGKITALIASEVPKGEVLGIDLSQEMVEFAKRMFPKESYPNLAFLLKDAQTLDYEERFDVIFSSFALQWLPDKDSFLKGAYHSLRPMGYLAATIPLGVSDALEQTIAEVTARPEWKEYFVGFSVGWNFISDREWAELLQMHRFIPTRFVVVSQDAVFGSRELLEKYIIQWFMYLRPIPDDLKAVFFKQIIDRYLELEPIRENGKAHLIFSRLEILAIKELRQVP